jgi:hypothetical protein
MPQKFVDINQRANDADVDAGWFNVLRLAGITIEDFLGGADLISETAFTIVNNQSSVADVTGLLFNHLTVGAAKVEYWIKRVTTGSGATELTEYGFFYVTRDVGAGVWRITPMPSGPDNAGVTLSMSALAQGQVQYVSTNITGTASVSKMKFKASTMGV